MANPQKPAGWYPDPADLAFEIYWNGSAWTAMRRPVAAVPSAPPVGAPSAPPSAGASPGGTSGGLGGFWAGLPKWGKVAVVALPALALLMLLPGGCGHSASWKYGYNQSTEYGDELLPLGISEESVCRTVSRSGGSDVNTVDAYKGCLAGLKDKRR
jgi:hypothetical protein